MVNQPEVVVICITGDIVDDIELAIHRRALALAKQHIDGCRLAWLHVEIVILRHLAIGPEPLGDERCHVVVDRRIGFRQPVVVVPDHQGPRLRAEPVDRHFFSRVGIPHGIDVIVLARSEM